jgi:mono/diheme cytochrome c family protein
MVNFSDFCRLPPGGRRGDVGEDLDEMKFLEDDWKMKKRCAWVPVTLLWWVSSAMWAAPPAVAAAGPQPQTASVAAASAAQYRAVLDKYCVTCHNERAKVGGLMLDKVDLSNIPAGAPGDADVLEKVVRKVRVGMMPPQGAPRPDPGTQHALVAWLTAELDRAALARPNPGRGLIHRLNRAEYANAIRDLLALDVDTSSMLPPDDSAYGFDNIADALGVSPVLLERYLTAADKIASLAIGDPESQPAGQTFRIRQDASQDTHIEGLPVGTEGGILAKTTLPLDGEYDFSIRLFRTNLGVVRGLEYDHSLEYTVDGERVHLSKVGGDDDFRANLKNMTKAGDDVEARAHFRMPLKAGPHIITVAFLNRTAAANPLRLQPFIRSSNDTLDTIGHPHLDTFTLTGPFNPTGPGDTPSRRRVLFCRPTGRADEEACAGRILSTFARRAYRGVETAADLRRLQEFYQAGRRGGNFEAGIRTALQRILASPKFVFRVERDPESLAPGAVYRVSDLELASRLSFFLWSSIPDDELLRVARQGTLKIPAVLDHQVRRMLEDPKSEALVTNFAGQWLYLRNLKSLQPNSNEFPDFDDNLRQALHRETELFFASIMREDRNVLDLMTASYTFLNERLAKHYGVPNVYGSQFRRVTLDDEARRGLLGKGAILMVTSHADRTSPVVRGKWILDNLLDAPPPPPPAVVPPLDESNQRAGKILTMRERMEEHRKNPVCAGCHKIMDPIGLSLENFDAVGRWRTRDGGTLGPEINASGELLDGTRVDGVVTLRQALVKQPEIFVSTVTEKLLTYALGRGLAYYDMPTVRAIVRDAASHDYRFSSLVRGIVNSTPFQRRAKVIRDIDNPAQRTAAR